MKTQTPMKDWRGNEYPNEKFWYHRENGSKIPRNCDICLENQAVRNCCHAEGEHGRTHWHGAVHTIDGGMKLLCRKCADLENQKWDKR